MSRIYVKNTLSAPVLLGIGLILTIVDESLNVIPRMMVWINLCVDFWKAVETHPSIPIVVFSWPLLQICSKIVSYKVCLKKSLAIAECVSHSQLIALVCFSDIYPADLIRNDNPFENDGLSMTNYLMLYSDNSCSELEGVKGIVAGDTALPITPEDMSCEAAVACSLYPAGEQCATNGGTTGDVFTFRTKPAESKAIVCLDENEEHCVEIDPKECIKSEVYPSCWYHLVTAKRLFAEPDAYIVGTKYVSADAPVTGGQAAPAIAPAGAPPSGVITSGPTPVGGEPLPADDSSSHLWGNVMSVVALVLFTLMTLLD